MNKRAVIGLALVFLFAFSAAAFASGGSSGGSGHHPKTATLQVKAGSAEQGGTLKLRARAKHGDRTQAFGATAVVHFVSGDVTVTLERHGKSFNARVKVPVAQDEALGDVPVDFSVTYGAAVQAMGATATIRAADEDHADDPSET
jgi:hypothetical protein